MPLVFPQYGRASGVAAYAGVGSGAVPSNGFLSRLHWTLVETGVTPPHAPDPAPRAVFAAEWDADTYAMWPHRFGAIYTVRWVAVLTLCCCGAACPSSSQHSGY